MLYTLSQCISRSGELTKTHAPCALSLLVQVSTNGLETHPQAGNFLVQSLAAEAGSLREARQVFEKLEDKSVRSWNSLVIGYAKHNYPADALMVFQKMQEFSVDPDSYALVALLKTCLNLNQVQTGLEIHGYIRRKGVVIDIFLGSMLVDMYGKYGFFKEALEVFENLRVRDVVPWTSLIQGYAEYGHVEESISLFEQMQLEGVSPDAASFLCCLNVCSSAGFIEKGQELHACIVRRGDVDNELNVNNALIDMYAKCGLLDDAVEIFEKLPVRDIISWNALMTGYTKHGHNLEALVFYDRMRLGGISPDIVTYICILKNCGSICAIEKGCDIHDEVNRRGFLREAMSINIGNALIDMYASCGSLKKAQNVFDYLPVKDLITWTTLISGYTNQGCSEQALICFECMQQDGICPSNVTYNSVLKACANSGAIEKGQQIHEDVSRKGLLESNTISSDALISMYAGCGLFLEANVVLEKQQVQDAALWTALIVGYLNHCCTEEALDCFSRMEANGVSPDAFSFVCFLKACGAVESVEKGQQLHSDIVKRGYLENDIVIGNALISMYVSCDMLTTAQSMFESLPIQNTISWTILIEAYSDNESGENAWKSFRQMQMEGVLPDIVTYNCILKACISARDVEKGYELHAILIILEARNVIGSTLIEFYVNYGLLHEAQGVFDELSTDEVMSWNSLIKGYAKSGYNQDALSCFAKMQVQKIAPNSATFICVLKACKNVRPVKGLELHAEIWRKGLIETDPIVGNVLIDMHISFGLISEACKVFDTLPRRDIFSWSALIAALVEHDCNEEAIILFQEMQFDKGICPDGLAFSYALKACSCVGAADKGRQVHAEITRKGILARYIPVGNALIDMYINSGFPAEAREVLMKLPISEVISWTTQLTGYAKYGQVEQALECFEKIHQISWEPLFLTHIDNGERICSEFGRTKEDEVDREIEIGFVSILNACSHSGEVDTGLAYFEAMNRREYGTMPSLEHWVCLIDLLCRAGQMNDALIVIDSMPFHPNLLVWHSVLGASRKWNSVELGEHAFAHAIQLRAEDSSVYIGMSNIYISAEKPAEMDHLC